MSLASAGIAAVVTNDNQYLIDGFYGLRSDRKPALVVHEIETGDLVASIDLDYPMHTIAISDDDQHLITGHFDGTVLVWDFASLLQGNERSSSP
ncbi:MAG: hypothetical protein KDA87_14020 [Planctomycetales bacterium]|nr:hypothetical protein [Planctomycetales bacterium]